MEIDLFYISYISLTVMSCHNMISVIFMDIHYVLKYVLLNYIGIYYIMCPFKVCQHSK